MKKKRKLGAKIKVMDDPIRDKHDKKRVLEFKKALDEGKQFTKADREYILEAYERLENGRSLSLIQSQVVRSIKPLAASTGVSS